MEITVIQSGSWKQIISQIYVENQNAKGETPETNWMCFALFSFSFTTNFSYRFDLDTAKHISLTPAVFYSNTVVEKSHDFFVSLSLGLKKHSLGITSTLNHNVGLFYQYNFNNKCFIGASIGNNYSLLSSNIFKNSYYSGMLRLGYSIQPKLKFIGTPAF